MTILAIFCAILIVYSAAITIVDGRHMEKMIEEIDSLKKKNDVLTLKLQLFEKED